MPTNKFILGLQPSPLSVGFILLPHFTLLPFAAFVDALRLAADEGDQSRQILCKWTVMGSQLNNITSSCGITVQPWVSFRDPSEFDYVVVVGGLTHKGSVVSSSLINYLQLAACRTYLRKNSYKNTWKVYGAVA